MKRILIIDDEPSICASLEFALEDEYEVESTTDPDQGVQLIKESHYHLCLLDLKIGNRDGLDVLQEIKQEKPGMIVIMITPTARLNRQ
ncbi:response regulator [Thalassobacillus sp. C254]|uniref:response regulator n=1 Tax=Thalassobacillus sp. C254 TaxID=1225341 RepID=UPI00277D06EF|nr:response regulator [Thalassobacillus sp. C254]